MDWISIKPKVGMGPFKLGMSDFDVKKVFIWGWIWREGVINEEIIQSEEFLELPEENQELEKRYFYFTTVSIFVPGYYDSLCTDYPHLK